MAARSSASFLLGIVLFSFSFNVLNARPIDEVQGFDKQVFDYHFDRADRELDPESWLREARRGLEYGIAAWERTAWELYAEPMLARDAMREMTRWSEEELEQRYAQWLFKRFFGAEAGGRVHTMDEAVEEANRLYAFHTDTEGNLLYDESGDPDSVRPYEGRSTEEDLLLWNQLVSRSGNAELKDYELSLDSVFPELCSSINSTEKPGTEARLAEMVNRSIISRRSEFEAMLAREERLFVARRTGDRYSLRKASEQESAAAVSVRLIREAENYCASGIADLEERIEAARTGEGDRSPAAEEWLTVFREQFEKGLKAWSEAEERFLVRRMEWERDSGERFREGQEVWQTAFAELEKERRSWEQRAAELFHAGEQLFTDVSETLNTAIAEAKETFQRDAALRVSGARSRAQAMADMYLTCGSVVAEARNSVDFLRSRFVPGAPEDGLENGTLAAWVQQTLDEAEKNPDLLQESQKAAGKELIRWTGLYSYYREKTQESLAALENELSLVLDMDGKALNSVLDVSGEDFFLDEYQIELLRAKAVSGYWEQRLSVAEAVSAYAEDLSAGRMTEAEGLRQWRESKSRYDDALKTYEISQGKLKSAGLELASVQEALRTASAILLEEEQKLEALNERYSLRMAAEQLTSVDFIRSELDAHYRTLSQLMESRNADSAYYTPALKAEQSYFDQYEVAEGWELLKSIMQSETTTDEKTTQLALLRENYSPELQNEAVKNARRSFTEVFAEFGIESGGTMPALDVAADTLLRYGEEHDVSPAHTLASLMIRLDEESGMLPVILEEKIETWKETFLSYMAAKIVCERISVPDEAETSLTRYEECLELALELYDKGEDYQAIEREASFHRYIVNFLSYYDTCSAVPVTDAGKKHWRRYIGDLSAEACMLADAYDTVKESSRKMTETFELIANSSPSDQRFELLNEIEQYLADPEKAWEDRAANYDYSIAWELFRETAETLRNSFEYEESLKQKIAVLGFEYDSLSSMGTDVANDMETIFEEREKAKTAHQDAFNVYKRTSEAFLEEGIRYERLYGETKQLFETIEQARIAYEKDDAIRRWAGTAYLGNSLQASKDRRFYRAPTEELVYAREQNNRARIALRALEDLYKNNESSRAYENEEYVKIYNEYKESFSRMFLILKAKTEFTEDFEKEQEGKRELYFNLSTAMSSFVSPEMPGYYDEYTLSLLDECSWFDFVKISESGDLCISRDRENGLLTPISAEDASDLSRYFKQNTLVNDSSGQLSGFEEAFAAWSTRMESYELDNNNHYKNWGLALDYFIRTIIENNRNIETIAESYDVLDMGADGQLHLDGTSLNNRINGYRNSGLREIQKNAWDSLSNQQQNDLEFLALLYVTGGGGKGSSGLAQVSRYEELAWLSARANHYVVRIYLLFTTMTAYRWPYTIDHSELSQVRGTVNNRMSAYKKTIDENRTLFTSELSNVVSKLKAYNDLCETYSILSVKRENGILWPDIEAALSDFSDNEKKRLQSYWEKMLTYRGYSGENPYTTIGSALDTLYAWGKGIQDTTEQKLEATYSKHQDERGIHQNTYRSSFDAFIDGEAALDTLNKTAESAYGHKAAALKNHLYNMGTVMLSDLKEADTDRAVYTEQYRELTDRYVALIERAYNARFLSELSAREVSWNERRKDLNNKQASWREASALILERGRQDWKEGREAMIASFNQWKRDFSEHYTDIDAAWNAAYLESLNNKEHWINQVVTAASESLDSKLLTMMGNEAASFGRQLDTFIPSAFPGQNSTEEAGELLRSVLNSAGITKMYDTFETLAASTKTVSTITESGVAGLGVWDSGQVQAAARDFAQTATNTLADGKMTLLAFKARESVYEAKKALDETIVQSNKHIDAQIDELYTLNGGWQRSGNNYIKEIIVHSTLFRSAITDHVTLDSYRFFVLEYWDFVTDLSDANLKNLNHLGVQGIIARAEEEIEEKSKQVFGDGDSEGAFGAWVGEAPTDEHDKGTGELGRLLYAFNTWENKQAQGISAMNAAFWDKPLWDSRESWFSSPSLRSAIDTMNSIASAVVGAVLAPFSAGGSLALAYGINMTDDLFFNALDVANGYKDWGEFGFTVGKTALINAAATAGKVVFSGLGQALDGSTKFAGLTAKAIERTSMAGTQNVLLTKTTNAAMSGIATFSTSTVTGALGAISYNNGKFGWNLGDFTSSMKNALVSVAVARTSALTAKTMNMGLEGFDGKHYYDGVSLSSFAGGLAGQGISYALGGDITLNAFNLGSFNRYMEGLGLVELHFDRNGFSGNFGTGGLDVSLGTLAGASLGLEAWKVNFDIFTSGSESARNYASQMRTLYSSGDTGKNLYNSILANETMILEDRNVGYTKTVYDPVIGKMIVLGNDAINDKSRFGLNVVFSHEAYRNGIDDGVEGQRQETTAAVMGHVSAALGLMQTYGGGVLGEAMTSEAKKFADNYDTLMSGTASEQKKMEALTGLGTVLGSYDSSGDYWRMQHNGTLVSDGSGWLRDECGYYINDDGTRTFTPTEQTIGAENTKTGLLNIMFGGNNFSKGQVAVAESILKAAGLAANGAGRNGIKLSMDYVMHHAGNTVFSEVFNAYYNNTMDYNIANVYNVDLIFNKKGNWRPNKVYSNSSERYTQLLREKYDAYSRNELIDLLKDKYLQTMVTDEGKVINMLKNSKDNPYISMLQNQNSIAFSNPESPYYNYSLWQWGCNFMTVIAIPQLLTGNVLNAREVTDVWNWAVATENSKGYDFPSNRVVTGSGSVNDADMLANHVLQDLFGYQYHSLSFNRDSLQRPEKNGVTNFVAVREQYDPTHFFLDNTNLEKIYDPWPYINRAHQRYDGVFLDIRRRSGNGYR